MADKLIGGLFGRARKAKERRYVASSRDVGRLMRLFNCTIEALATAQQPGAVMHDISRLSGTMQKILEEPARRAHNNAVRLRNREEQQAQLDLLLTVDYLSTAIPDRAAMAAPARLDYAYPLARRG